MEEIYKYNLEDELISSKKIATLVLDKDFAEELYAALCNMMWYKLPESEDERVLHRLKYSVPEDFNWRKDCWSTSWRGSGHIVATLRNNAGVHAEEEYLDWYCAGREGNVSPRVLRTLNDMGWYPVDWPTNED
jgi:hypothetical protein